MFIAVDWGTSNRRCYAIDDDGVIRGDFADASGVAAIARSAFPREVRKIRDRLGDHPMLCAGMVGSTLGWVEAGYVASPCDAGDIARACVAVDARTMIAPGVSAIDAGRPDVMRGEEVQVIGAVALGMGPADGLYCQPGTHSKWVRVAGGNIVALRTAMTGELFALLGAHSVLRDYLGSPVEDGAAFRGGVRLAGAGQLLSDLFGQRAAVLLGWQSPQDIAARVSGLLIGTEVREQGLPSDTIVHLLAEPKLGHLYAAALAELGIAVVTIDSNAAFVAGAHAIWRSIHADRDLS